MKFHVRTCIKDKIGNISEYQHNMTKIIIFGFIYDIYVANASILTGFFLPKNPRPKFESQTPQERLVIGDL